LWASGAQNYSQEAFWEIAKMGEHPAPAPTPRELEVLRLICEGHSTKQVAGLLGISVKTAACHRMRLMEKAGVHDPINLLRWAIQRGYVTVERPVPPVVVPPQLPTAQWSLTLGDRTTVGKLTIAFQEYQRAREKLEEYLSADAEGIGAGGDA
jgi:DNA-binding CsgD family transcriptional regulator